LLTQVQPTIKLKQRFEFKPKYLSDHVLHGTFFYFNIIVTFASYKYATKQFKYFWIQWNRQQRISRSRNIQRSLIYQHPKSKPKHIYRFQKTYPEDSIPKMVKSLDKTKHRIKIKLKYDKKQYPSIPKL